MAWRAPRRIRIAGIAFGVGVMPIVVSMLPFVLVFGALPATMALALASTSLQLLVRNLSASQVCLGVLALALSVVSVWTLKRMFLDGSGATYLPYWTIAVTIPIVIVQSLLARAAKGHAM